MTPRIWDVEAVGIGAIKSELRILENHPENAQISRDISKLTARRVVERDPERCLREAQELAMEVTIPDEDADKIRTVGAAVSYIESKL